jgi:hypothetical protein
LGVEAQFFRNFCKGNQEGAQFSGCFAALTNDLLNVLYAVE